LSEERRVNKKVGRKGPLEGSLGNKVVKVGTQKKKRSTLTPPTTPDGQHWMEPGKSRRYKGRRTEENNLLHERGGGN